ncbi:hypothetical protein B0H13DRAFT_2362720 [Mycena leptocephala]|nr:hypothetical protein B0H13DRAFT_2362720 [Mycena leptocephala]
MPNLVILLPNLGAALSLKRLVFHFPLFSIFETRPPFRRFHWKTEKAKTMSVATVIVSPPSLAPESGGAQNLQGTLGPARPQIPIHDGVEEVRGSLSRMFSQEMISPIRTSFYSLEDDVQDEPKTPKSPESLNTRVDTLEIHFDGLTKRVEGLKRKLDDMRGDIYGVEGTLAVLERTFRFKVTLTVSQK